ncbi:MAG TPA: aldo/keto reductase [Flavobacteriales bacterium]|jgi:aryl-alcohol dehydrogenase-like predicted oxidoreductase|nr:aldo/keto reductase [Flavobacteriales bacterium]
MNIVTLPKTSLIVSRFGFGTSSLHHIFYEKDRQKLLNKALDFGYTHFDTARMYGDGMCEKSLGIFFSKVSRDSVTVATKFGIRANSLHERYPVLMYANKIVKKILPLQGNLDTHIHDFSVASANESITKSLSSLQTDWIDIFFLHEPKAHHAPEIEKLVDWLLVQKSIGRVKYIGLAGHASDCVFLQKYFHNLFDVLQIEDSISGKESNLLLKENLPLQVTYGYLRKYIDSSPEKGVNLDAGSILKYGLKRNKNGMILVSTTKSERLRKMAEICE